MSASPTKLSYTRKLSIYSVLCLESDTCHSVWYYTNKSMHKRAQESQSTPLVLTLGSLRQENLQFKVSLSYIVRLYFKIHKVIPRYATLGESHFINIDFGFIIHSFLYDSHPLQDMPIPIGFNEAKRYHLFHSAWN